MNRVTKGPRQRWLFMAGLLVSTVICSLSGGQEKKFSGPQPGELLSPFTVLEVNRPEQVAEVQIARRTSDDTTVLMFMHKLSEPAIGLMMTIEWYAARQEDVTSHYIMLT